MLTAGLDIGTTSMKIVVLYNKKVFCMRTVQYTQSGIDVLEDLSLKDILENKNLQLNDLNYTIATGIKIDHSAHVNSHIIESIVHARWAQNYMPSTKLILDIGHLKTIATKCANGKVINTITSDKCASGAGIFLQAICDVLEMDIGSLNKNLSDVKDSITIENTCAVFAESEIISMLYQGEKPEKILMGALKGLASRIYPLILKSGIKEDILVVGGYAKIKSLINAIEDFIRHKVTISDHPQYAAAYGAALLAQDVCK